MCDKNLTWFSEPKIFIIWLLAEKVCWVLAFSNSFQTQFPGSLGFPKGTSGASSKGGEGARVGRALM